VSILNCVTMGMQVMMMLMRISFFAVGCSFLPMISHMMMTKRTNANLNRIMPTRPKCCITACAKTLSSCPPRASMSHVIIISIDESRMNQR